MLNIFLQWNEKIGQMGLVSARVSNSYVNFCISYIEKRIREGGDELGVLN